jgi:hypothetical protein
VTDHRPQKGSAASVTEIRQCANRIIRLHGITTTTSPAPSAPKAVISRSAAAASLLYYAHCARLSGYDCEQVKACCIAAGLPVIDSRLVAFEDVVRLAVRGPMAAVGEEASPPPYHALSYAPLSLLANAYRAAGAEVFNIPVPAGPATPKE